MTRIDKHIKAMLKDNADLFDSKAYIDKTLTYPEQRHEIQAKLNLMIDRPTMNKQALKGTYKAIKEQDNLSTELNKRHIQKVVRQGFKKLKTGQEITQLFNLNK